MAVFAVLVAFTVVRKLIPEDPQAYITEGMAAVAKGDVATVERSVKKLKNFPEHAAEQKLLEGILILGKSKPLMAIPLLKEAAADPRTRVTALTQLGSAYMQSRQRAECIEAFEMALKEDENADTARLNLAHILKEMVSWEDALKHLGILKDHQFNLGVVHQLIADIHAESGRNAEAADEFRASIEADPTNPTNSQKASRLIRCQIAVGDLSSIEEFVSMVDNPGIHSSANALILAKKGEVNNALTALDNALLETPNDKDANLAYAEIMAGIETKGKAIEALASLQQPASFQPRNLRMFEFVTKIATTAERVELASVAQQNVDQLRDLESQFAAKLSEVVKTRDDAKSRIELGDLAAATGRMEFARAAYMSASFVDRSQGDIVDEKVLSLFSIQEVLVPMTMSGDGDNTDPPPGETAPGTSAEPTTPEPKTPELSEPTPN